MIKFEATEEEIGALAGLIDAGLRAVGLRSAKDAAIWAAKLDDAVKTVQAKEVNNTVRVGGRFTARKPKK